MNKSVVCRGCMNDIENNGLSLSNSDIAELYQNCTRIQINKDDLISNVLCDECFLKCNQWKTFKYQCESSEQELRELSIKQIKTAINEIEFLDLGLEIKEEESDQEYEVDNSFSPPELVDHSSEEDDKKPLSELCEVKMENHHDLSNKSSLENEKTRKVDKLQAPIKMLVKKAKTNTKDSFIISKTPAKEDAIKYTINENLKVEWNKKDTEYKDTTGSAGQNITVYKCKICRQIFRGLNIYEVHFLSIHMNKEVMKCRICNEPFSRESSLKQHLSRSHVVTIKTPLFKCEECDVEFEREKQLKQHNQTHLIFKCDDCENIFNTESQLRKHSRLHQRFFCDKCDKCFNRKYTLKLHEKTHIDDRPFVCSTCNFAFKTNVNLQSHIKIHKNERNFICPTCGKMFLRSHALKKHMLAHTDERPFKCPHCPRASKSSQQFKKHMETHNTNAVKPHICEFCNRSFRIKKVYVHHRMTHTGERPHECSLCDRKFIQTIALKKHMKTHEAI